MTIEAASFFLGAIVGVGCGGMLYIVMLKVTVDLFMAISRKEEEGGDADDRDS